MGRGWNLDVVLSGACVIFWIDDVVVFDKYVNVFCVFVFLEMFVNEEEEVKV